MFNKFQNYLLLHYPLLWNIRIVPIALIMLIVQLIFFGIGYSEGVVDFTDPGFNFNYRNKGGLMIFYSILISLFVFIGWMVFYFRNNAFKSYYPQSNFSLYKEWLLILLVCVMNCTYTASYYYAFNLRQRNYFTEQEFSKRIDIISMASVFIEGPLKGDQQFKAVAVVTDTIDDSVDSILYNNKRYVYTSLINKQLMGFTYQSHKKDSLLDVRVKGWLIHNRKDSVLWLMNQFDKIAQSHNLKSNVAPQQWLNLTYNYPEFEKYTIVGKAERYQNDGYDYSDDYTDPATTVKSDIHFATINGVKYKIPNYYVPLLQLSNNYTKISGAWTSPDPTPDALLIYIYFSISASLAIFSFRVTSGRNWLIALLSVGLTGLITGAFTLAAGSESAFQIMWLTIIIGLTAYFVSVINAESSKGISAVLVNALLWLAPYATLLLLLTITVGSRHNIYNDIPEDSFYKWVTDNNDLIITSNIVFIFIYMYFFSAAIKKWKGIAEA